MGVQSPWVQRSLKAQLLLHPLQWEALFVRSTQTLPQRVSPFWHWRILQVPATQSSRSSHTLPQKPQLVLSLLRSTHVPLQSACPSGHCLKVLQTPPIQLSPAAHALLQRLQCSLDVFRFTHTVVFPLEQAVRPPLHLHCPPEQVCVALQTKPQTPQ